MRTADEFFALIRDTIPEGVSTNQVVSTPLGLIAATLAQLPPATYKSGVTRAELKKAHPLIVNEILQRLHVLWSDDHFWRLVSEKRASATLSNYVREKYKLLLPAAPSAVWHDLARWETHSRERLFLMISMQTYRLLPLGLDIDVAGARAELSQKKFHAVLNAYLKLGADNLAGLCAALELSKDALTAAKWALQQALKDLEWCDSHPGEVPLPIPAAPAGGTHSYRLALLTEKIMSLITDDLAYASIGKASKALTNIKEVAELIESLALKPNSLTSCIRRAKYLREYRQQLSVRHHAKKGARSNSHSR